VLIYRLADSDIRAAVQSHFTPVADVPIVFGNALELLGYDLQTRVVSSGETVTLVTLWQLQRPLPGATFFTHLIGVDEKPIAQADLLGAPGELWHPGDLLLQLHHFTIPSGTPAGDYSLIAGVYTQPKGPRLPIAGRAGGDTAAFLTTLTVTP
jgi:hypothetical protein